MESAAVASSRILSIIGRSSDQRVMGSSKVIWSKI